jgi:glutamate/tyrosine decarboxylase-like PLP-dependent enzyme
VDFLAEMCELTHAHGGWVHLDAAFGLWAAASPTLRAGLTGLASADSWATDAHKWLNVPYDCGIALCAHPDAHRAAMRAQADYLPAAAGGLRDPMDYTPEMSRRARALVLWTTLRHLGADGVAELVERCCALARRMAEALARIDGVTVVNQVALNQVLVRFAAAPAGPAGRAAAAAADDAHTLAVVDAFQRGGVGWASPTWWQGRATLRLSICNWRTDVATVDAAVRALAAAHLGSRAAPPDGHLPAQVHPRTHELITEATA